MANMHVKSFIASCFYRYRSYSSLTMSYIHNVGKEPLKALTLGKILDIAENNYPNRLAVISRLQNQQLTFAEFKLRSDKFAAGLLTIGLKTGDRVGLWSSNSIEWMIAAMACARIGLPLATLNPAYQVTEIEYCINKADIKAIICPESCTKYNYHRILQGLIPELSTCHPKNIYSKNTPSLQFVIIVTNNYLRGTYNFEEVVELGNNEVMDTIRCNQDSIDPSSEANMQFTSGTTGAPKAAAVSHFSVVNNSYYIGQRNELYLKHHKICVQVPFFHAYGFTVALASALNFGATIVIPSFTYNSLENLKAIKDEKCTIVFGTPTMYIDLINLQKELKFDISPEIAVTGGAPCTPQLFKDIKSILNVNRIKSIYGLSEMTAVAFQSLDTEEDEHKVTQTVGHIMDHLEAKVCDENGKLVPIGIPGELYLRGYSTMLGYFNDEKKTKETITKDWWLQTGDQFVLQKDGYGKIIGRIKDMIIRGGENIYPKEIENFLVTHPDIADAQVIGLKHERLGEDVCACLILKRNIKLTEVELRSFCNGKISDYKIPSRFYIVNEFPKTVSGKVMKYILKEKLENL